MAKSLHARLVAYRPFGARIGVLAEPVSFSASMLHNDDGAISIEYSLLSGDAQAFDRDGDRHQFFFGHARHRDDLANARLAARQGAGLIEGDGIQ